MIENPGYAHTQRGIIRPILWASAAVCLVLMGALYDQSPLALVFASTAGIFVLLSCAFAHLTVRDEGDRLAVRFGPIRFFGKTIPYADMTAVEHDRSTFLTGWGIHWTRTGCLWNIGGYDRVRIRMGEKSIRIGTDDSGGLVAFLRSRIGEDGTAAKPQR